MPPAAIFSCCDIVPAGPATTNWVKPLEGKGKVCEPEHDAHTPAPDASRLANGTGNSTMDMDMDHAGHDHAAMGHDLDHAGNASKATAPAAKPAGGAKSGVSAVAAGVKGAVGAAAAAVVFLML